MGPIVEAAVPRRSDELPPPSLLKDVPNDLSLRSLSNSASYSRFFASFSCCVVSFSLYGLAKSAPNAATSSSDKTIILQLVPTPRRCPSYILLGCSGPRWPPYQLYLTRSSRPPMATVLSETKCTEKVCTSPARLTNVYVAPLT